MYCFILLSYWVNNTINKEVGVNHMIKRARILIYFLIAIMMSISIIFNTILQQNYILESKRDEVQAVAQLLDKELNGTYDDYIEDPTLSKEEKIKMLNKKLQPFVDEVTTSFPEVGAGYYVRDLDSIVAFGPNFREEGLKDIKKESKAREVYEKKEAIWFDSVSQTRENQVVARIHPIIRDGKVIGHVWGNVTIDNLQMIFLEQVKKSVELFVILMIIGVIGVQLIVYYYRKALETFTNQLLSVSSNRKKFKRFFPEFDMIVEEYTKNKEKIENSERRFRDVVNAFDEYVWEMNEKLEYIFISKRITAKTGYEQEELLGKKVIDIVSEEDREKIKHIVQDSLQNRVPLHQLEYRIIAKNGDIRWMESSAVLMYDQDNQVIGYRGATRDITQEKVAKEKLHKLAYKDTLTNLPNRFWLEEMIHAKMVQNAPFNLIFIDTDQFKLINDSLGYEQGDKVLNIIGQRLHKYVNHRGEIARFGGDDFVILLDCQKNISLDPFIKGLIREFQKPLYINEETSIFITISIGISCFPEDTSDSKTLIRYADLAMACAKRNGRNNYLYYQTKMNEHAVLRMALKNDLYQALEKKELFLVYQPQVHIHSEKVHGVESLIRWNHPEKGLIRPDHFISIAEETGLIVPIGKWVLEEACRQGKEWMMAGLAPMIISVNVSIHQLEQPDFVQIVRDVLQETGFPPASLQLEVTESIAMYNFESIIPKLEELQRFGLSISVDDFGKEYSSLSYLKQLPINQMKIDRSFQMTLTDRKTQSIVKSIIELAHNLQLEVVAEGVERSEEKEILKQYDCDIVQGYYYAKPLQATEFKKWLQEFKG